MLPLNSSHICVITSDHHPVTDPLFLHLQITGCCRCKHNLTSCLPKACRSGVTLPPLTSPLHPKGYNPKSTLIICMGYRDSPETSVFMTDVPHACVKWDWSLLILYYLWILTSSWYRVWNTAVWNCSHLTYSFFSRSSLSSWPSAVITTRALEGCLKKKTCFSLF